MIRRPVRRTRLPIGWLSLGALLWAVGLATAAPVITDTDVTDFYTTGEIMAAKENDTLPVQIFGGPSARATRTGAAAPLTLPATVGGGRVVPAGSQAPEIRMVLLFNPGSLDPEIACGSPAEAGARKKDGPLDVFAVLCRGDEFFSQAHLKDGSVRGETDPDYADAMSRLLLALMPPDTEAEREQD